MSRFFVFSTVLGMMFGLLSVTSMPALGNHDPNVIHACVKKLGGAIRIVSSASKCIPLFEKAIELQLAGAGNEDTCPDDMVEVGDFCIDKYEASVWDSPDGTGIQFGADANFDTFPDNDYPCSDNGNDCSDSAANPIYALSLPNVTPSGFITWFQAQQACLNVGKRLSTNAEWQGAAAGTPDPGTDNDTTDCNITFDPGSDPGLTGSRSNCVSNFGAFDMVGNLHEWIADWIQDNTDSDLGTTSPALYGMDAIVGIDEAFSPLSDNRFPSALFRGGGFFDVGPGAGVFALFAGDPPSASFGDSGFRCARNR